jgi:hypothetical protein
MPIGAKKSNPLEPGDSHMADRRGVGAVQRQATKGEKRPKIPFELFGASAHAAYSYRGGKGDRPVTKIELQFLLYVAQHLNPYDDDGYSWPMSYDEFVNGRKMPKGGRYDSGSGLTKKEQVSEAVRRLNERTKPTKWLDVQSAGNRHKYKPLIGRKAGM